MHMRAAQLGQHDGISRRHITTTYVVVMSQPIAMVQQGM